MTPPSPKAGIAVAVALSGILALPFVLGRFAESGTLSGSVWVASAFASLLIFALAGILWLVSVRRRRSLAAAALAYLLWVLLPAAAIAGAAEMAFRRDTRNFAYEFAAFDGQRFTVERFHVRLNRDGWRSDFDYGPLKDGPAPVVLIGDSFVHGVVDQPDTLANAMMAGPLADTRIKVASLGRSGADPTDYASFAGSIKDWRPRAVFLLLYMGDDVPRGAAAVARRRSPTYRALRGRVKDILSRSAVTSALGDRLDRARAWREIPEPLAAALPRRGFNPAIAASLSRVGQADLDAMARTFAATHAVQDAVIQVRDSFPASRFYLVLMPMSLQVSERYIEAAKRFGFQGNATLDDGLQRAVAAWARSQGICTLDLLPGLRAEEAASGKPLYDLVDAHLNRAGNRFVAAELARYLRASAPCERAAPPP